MTSLIEDMRIDHGRADILMTQQFLDGPYVITRFKQMGRERMTKSMTASVFDNASFSYSLLDGPLKDCFMNVVAQRTDLPWKTRHSRLTLPHRNHAGTNERRDDDRRNPCGS